MKNILLIITILINGVQLQAQNELTKKELKKIFYKRQDYNEWLICNNDSSYFYQDTIILHNKYQSYFTSKSCCNYVTWTFNNRREVNIGESRSCQEPPISISHPYSKFQFKIKKKHNKLELHLKNQIHDRKVFTVEALEKHPKNRTNSINNEYQIILTRKVKTLKKITEQAINIDTVDSEGFYVHGFEYSGFMEINDSNILSPAWITFSESLIIQDSIRILLNDLPDFKHVYLKIKAIKRTIGHFGHLGGAEKEFEVLEINNIDTTYTLEEFPK